MIIKSHKVTSIGLDNSRLDVLWQWSDDSDSVRYEVWVERSLSLSGPFAVIAKTFGASSYTDWEADPDFVEGFYYRLRVKRRDTGDTEELTDALSFKYEADLIAAEIRRRSELLFREFTSRPVLYYPRKSGPSTRCPDCWDPVSAHRTRSRCETCFDTGYLMGYFNPLLLHVPLTPDPVGVAADPEIGEIPMRTAVALLPGELSILAGDLIVESINARWLLNSYHEVQKLRVTVHYSAQLHFVPETDIRYRVPLPSDDVFDRLEESREYTRPYTLYAQ